MSVADITALLTALSVAAGAIWTIILGRRNASTSAQSSLWTRAMDLIDRLTEENGVLKDENERLRAQIKTVRRPSQPSRTPAKPKTRGSKPSGTRGVNPK